MFFAVIIMGECEGKNIGQILRALPKNSVKNLSEETEELSNMSLQIHEAMVVKHSAKLLIAVLMLHAVLADQASTTGFPGSFFLCIEKMANVLSYFVHIHALSMMKVREESSAGEIGSIILVPRIRDSPNIWTS
jgi:hypothetical protein